jgi:hypothetical protein
VREWKLEALPQFVKKLRAANEVAVEVTGNTRLFQMRWPARVNGSHGQHQPVSGVHAIDEEDRWQWRAAIGAVPGKGVVGGGAHER